jgi:hypothetical protein
MGSLTPNPPPVLVSIALSPVEVKQRRLSEQHLEIAIRALHHDGLVVIENAIEHDALDKLNVKMVEDAKYLQSLGDNGPFNYNKGNLQQDAPPAADWFDPQIFLSKLLTGSYNCIIADAM